MPRQLHHFRSFALGLVGVGVGLTQSLLAERESALSLLQLPFCVRQRLLRLILSALTHLQDGFEPKAEARHADSFE